MDFKKDGRPFKILGLPKRKQLEERKKKKKISLPRGTKEFPGWTAVQQAETVFQPSLIEIDIKPNIEVYNAINTNCANCTRKFTDEIKKYTKFDIMDDILGTIGPSEIQILDAIFYIYGLTVDDWSKAFVSDTELDFAAVTHNVYSEGISFCDICKYALENVYAAHKVFKIQSNENSAFTKAIKSRVLLRMPIKTEVNEEQEVTACIQEIENDKPDYAADFQNLIQTEGECYGIVYAAGETDGSQNFKPQYGNNLSQNIDGTCHKIKTHCGPIQMRKKSVSKSNSENGSKSKSVNDSKSKSANNSKSKSAISSKSKSVIGSNSKSLIASKSKSVIGSNTKSLIASKSKSVIGSKGKSVIGSKKSIIGSKTQSKNGSKAKSEIGSKSVSENDSKSVPENGSIYKEALNPKFQKLFNEISQPENNSQSNTENGSKSKDVCILKIKKIFDEIYKSDHDSKSKSEDDSKSKSEDDSKSKSEDDSKSKSGNDSKSKSEDSTSKLEMDSKSNQNFFSKSKSVIVSKCKSGYGVKPKSENGSKSKSENGSASKEVYSSKIKKIFNSKSIGLLGLTSTEAVRLKSKKTSKKLISVISDKLSKKEKQRKMLLSYTKPKKEQIEEPLVCRSTLPLPESEDANFNEADAPFLILCCNEIFDTPYTFEDHRSKLHPEAGNGASTTNEAKCNICGLPVQVDQVSYHMRSIEHLSSNYFKSTNSDEPSPKAKSFKPPEDPSKAVLCKLCNIFFPRPRNLDGHYRRVHPELHKFKFYCDKCNKGFGSEYFLNNHIKAGNLCGLPKRRFVCAKCGKNYETANRLKVHMDVHEDEESADKEMFKCQKCGKMLKHRYSLQKHLQREHPENQKLFVCEQCGKTTKNMTNMRIHMETHGVARKKAASTQNPK